jgi:hypothetical protein
MGVQSSSVNTTLLHKSSYNVALYLDPRTGSLKVPLHLGQNDLQSCRVIRFFNPQSHPQMLKHSSFGYPDVLLHGSSVLQRRKCGPPPSNIQALNLGGLEGFPTWE